MGGSLPMVMGLRGYRFAEEVKLANEKQFKRFPIDSGDGQIGPDGVSEHCFQMIEWRQRQRVSLQAGPQDMRSLAMQVDADVQFFPNVGESKVVGPLHIVERRHMKNFVRLKTGRKCSICL